MKSILAGHSYELDQIDDPKVKVFFQFLTRFRGDENRPGPICQEVIRMLIDRVQALDKEVHWDGNAMIIWHLRMALVHFEARALIRKVEKHELIPETIPVGDDGHWRLQNDRG